MKLGKTSLSEIIIKLFILLICIVYYSFSANSPSEATNPFNEFLAPQGGVNLFSGDVAFSFPLATIPGINGINGTAALSYYSNVKQNVRTKNDRGPAGKENKPV